MNRHCYTCNGEHDPDDACVQPERPVTDSLFEDADGWPGLRLGPIFVAAFNGTCAACGQYVFTGDDIRSDGQGGYIHAEVDCERIAR